MHPERSWSLLPEAVGYIRRRGDSTGELEKWGQASEADGHRRFVRKGGLDYRESTSGHRGRLKRYSFSVGFYYLG